MPQTISTSNLGKALRSLQQLITTYQAICNSMLVLTNPVIRSVETRSRACSDPQLLVSFGKILNFSRAESSDQTSAQQSEAQQQVNYLAMTAKLAAKSIKLPRDLSSLEQATNFIERQFTARSEMLSIEIIEALTSQLTQIDWPQELAEQAKHEFQASLDNLSLALLLDKLDPSDQPHHISLSLLLSYLLATFKPTAEPPYILADIIAHCSTLAVLSTNEFLLSPVLDKLIKLPITNDFFKAVSQLFQTKIAQLATVPFTSKLRSSFRPNFQQQLLRLLAAANKLLGDSYNLEQLRELYNLSRLCKLSTSIGDLLVHNVTSRTEALFGTDNTLLGQFKLLLAVEAVNRATVKHVTFCSTLSLGIEHLLGKKGLKFNLSKTHSEWSRFIRLCAAGKELTELGDRESTGAGVFAFNLICSIMAKLVTYKYQRPHSTAFVLAKLMNQHGFGTACDIYINAILEYTKMTLILSPGNKSCNFNVTDGQLEIVFTMDILGYRHMPIRDDGAFDDEAVKKCSFQQIPQINFIFHVTAVTSATQTHYTINFDHYSLHHGDAIFELTDGSITLANLSAQAWHALLARNAPLTVQPAATQTVDTSPLEQGLGTTGVFAPAIMKTKRDRSTTVNSSSAEKPADVAAAFPRSITCNI